jgi:hypothetical protein
VRGKDKKFGLKTKEKTIRDKNILFQLIKLRLNLSVKFQVLLQKVQVWEIYE